MERVRIGVIGLGTMGRHYVKIYSDHPLSEVVAVSAPRQQQVDEVLADYKVEGYTDYRQMLERNNLDAVVVATPDSTHFEPARDALLRTRRAGEGQPVSVHARLRTVSFRLFEASYAAAGSKPQWMPQCSQRGSLPGPYASHSIPSSSASYVGKIPSVSR